MYTPYFDSFILSDDQSVSVSVFDDESLDVSDSASPSGSQFAPVPISESAHGSQFVSELQHALKSMRKAASLVPLLDISSETLALMSATQISMNELCARVKTESASCSSPMEFDSHEVDRAVTPPLTFPDYSSVLRPKALGTIATATGTKIEIRRDKSLALSPKKDEGPVDASFTTLTFSDDGSGITVFPQEHPMAPPKSRKCSKRNPKSPYSDNLKAWRSQPYGPRQLSKAPADLMMDFVIDPTTTAHQNHNFVENAAFYITPPSAHQFNRQLN